MRIRKGTHFRVVFSARYLSWLNYVVFILAILHSRIILIHALSSSSMPPSQDKLRITFVTGNAMKTKEMNLILQEKDNRNIEIRTLQVDLPEIQEADTVSIAKNKALLAAQLANSPCVVEDTSLQFNALGGMPGPFIKWFQDTLQSQGLYDILAAYPDKSAVAVCTLAFCPAPHADPVLFTGECHGTIVPPQEGRGFGWDSIFVPNDANGTVDNDRPFSLMDTAEKNRLSHRGKAVRKFIRWVEYNYEPLYARQVAYRASTNDNSHQQLYPGHKGLDFKVQFPEQ